MTRRLGEDVDGYTIQGYGGGGYDPWDRRQNGPTCTVIRDETTLGEFLRSRIAERYPAKDGALVYGLAFTGRTASVSGHGSVEIVRQNFGFDLEKGVTEVALDLNRSHYWMEVRHVPETR